MKNKNLIFAIIITILAILLLWVVADTVHPKDITYNKVVHYSATTIDDSISIVEKLSKTYNIVGSQIIPVYGEVRCWTNMISYKIESYKIVVIYNGGQ